MSDSTEKTDPSFREAQERYRETVFLPRTSFPMRGNLPQREPEILEQWATLGLDDRIREAGEGRPVFTLHDGPPYANGNIHIGHALNKVMKDVINRAQRMAGHEVRYMPGWDCHGLPIEWKVEEEYRKKGTNKDSVPVLQFRQECRDYADRWVKIQQEEFQRLGVQAEWDHRYLTMDFESEAQIVEEIGKFLLNGRLYRGLRPVMWSPVEKTALAEAEIEYHDITSTTVHVAFPVVHDTTGGKLEGASAVIWTTTPWTIPANRALAAGPDIAYEVMEVTSVTEESLVPLGSRLLVAQERLKAFAAEAGITAWNVREHLMGHELEGSQFAHPWRGDGRYAYDVPLLLGDFVTTEAGTGLVHMAPAHGEDDFRLCKTHGIPASELVQDNGTYTPLIAELGVPELEGVHVFKAAEPVCNLLQKVRAAAAEGQAVGLMARGSVVHSYPHSWRSRKPVIFRATPQWFIAMDDVAEPEKGVRHAALKALDDVRFVPDSARNRLTSMVANRPDWCISRQRSWGVPIAVFVEKRTGAVLRDAEVMQRVVDTFRVRGADAWYDTDPAVFLGEKYSPEAYEQVFDIVDVWFESGCSHRFVLHQNGVNFPADLYLEGSDQHRGWFQSSLLESIGAEGVAPYKAIVTNGFVLDGQGRKMSKSLGNTIAPKDVTQSLGADVLRLWVVNSDTNEDLRISKEILKQQGELYRRLRNTLRWLLGALDGFSEDEKIPYADLPSLEKYILHRLDGLRVSCVNSAVNNHQWNGVYPQIHAFCNNDLSAFYFDSRKDALYCDAVDSHTRCSARTVLDILHRTLTTWLAPVLVFTAEEAWQARFGEGNSVHCQLFPSPKEWIGDFSPDFLTMWVRLRGIRQRVTWALEAARRAGEINASLEAKVKLYNHAALMERVGFSQKDFADLCLVSEMEFVDDDIVGVRGLKSDTPGFEYLPDHRRGDVRIDRAEGKKCARCWRVLPEVGKVTAHPHLCLRCADVVAGSA